MKIDVCIQDEDGTGSEKTKHNTDYDLVPLSNKVQDVIE